MHLACSDITRDQYDEMCRGSVEVDYYCNSCQISFLPNAEIDNLTTFPEDSIRNAPDDEQSVEGEGPPSPERGLPPEPPNTTDDFDCFKKRGVHAIHLNTRSLLPKMFDFRLMANKTNASIIGITESWLDNTVNDSEISIPGYCVVRRDRDRNGGGVCVYVKSDMAYNVRPDLAHDNLEMVWVELLLPHSKPILVGEGVQILQYF